MDIVDFHAHILPRADHGSSSIEDTVFQLKSAALNGVSRIIATPHFYPQRENVTSFITRRDNSYKLLADSIADSLPSILLGAEILICDNIEEMPMLEQLCVSGTRILLIELPFTDFSQGYINSTKELIKQGYTVVIAHADRYESSHIDQLIRAGAYIQLNADSLSKIFISKHIKKWIKENKVYAIGSDIHKRDSKAYVRFKKAINKLGEYATNLKKHSDSIWIKKTEAS